MKTRKEMKEEYKKMKFTMGVFLIRNKINGKVYIGSSLDLKAIWYAQQLQLNMGMHKNEPLQEDWKKYGADNFSYEIIQELKHDESKEINYAGELKLLEEMVIDELQPFDDKGYHKKRN